MTSLIDEYLEYIEVVLHRREATIEAYSELLHRMNTQIPAGLMGACADEIQEWIDAPTAQGLPRRAKTRAHYTNIAQGFFEWACDPARDEDDLERLDFNSAALLRKVKVPGGTRVRAITTDQVREILDRAENPQRRWFLIAGYAGLRCCEMAELQRSDITEKRLWVRGGKGGKERDVPTHVRIWEEVRDLDGPICLRRDGGPAPRRHISLRGNDYLRRNLGMAVHIHQFRKSYATRLRDNGVKIEVIQRLLGHSEVGTTMLYLSDGEDDMDAAVAGLD